MHCYSSAGALFFYFFTFLSTAAATYCDSQRDGKKKGWPRALFSSRRRWSYLKHRITERSLSSDWVETSSVECIHCEASSWVHYVIKGVAYSAATDGQMRRQRSGWQRLIEYLWRNNTRKWWMPFDIVSVTPLKAEILSSYLYFRTQGHLSSASRAAPIPPPFFLLLFGAPSVSSSFPGCS